MNKEIIETIIMNGQLTIMMTGLILMGCGRSLEWKVLGFLFILIIFLV